MSAALLAYLAARKRHKAARNRRDIDAVIDALKDDEDRAEDKAEAEKEAVRIASAATLREQTLRTKRASETCVARWTRRTLDVLSMTWLQMLQYLVMLYCFQSLSGAIRLPAEFYLDMFVNSMFVANTFDHRHYNLPKVHKTADVYTWMEQAMTAAVFHNAPEGQNWPDGDGPFSHAGSTPYTTSDMVNEANIFALPEGIVFKQLRMHKRDPSTFPCYANHSCFLQLEGVDDPGDTQPFGHANAALNMSEGHFKWWTRAELGANMEGVPSASHISGRVYSSSGYVAAYRAFFSDTLLPDEEGPTPDAVADFRLHEATATNGRQAIYRCARYSTNGNHTVQRCDPGSGGATGVTREMFGELIRYLKRGHWIDKQTAIVSVAMQAANQNMGVRFATRYIFEFSPLGGVLPSYDTECLISHPETLAAREMWLDLCLVLIAWFTFLELIEVLMAVRKKELWTYVSALWNVLDWINFFLFYYVYMLCKHERFLAERDRSGSSCDSHMCTKFGYFDAWEVFSVGRVVKLVLSFIVCIQFLKIIKFTNEVIPKMSLMTRVLSKASTDLVFFAIVFAISMFAFSNLFYLQLGSAVDNYYSMTYTVISLTRSLFGDFDIVEINENSKDYLNGVLYLFYLFISVFILLALFLSILGESQSAARDDELAAENRGEDMREINGYGVLASVYETVEGVFYALRASVVGSSPDPEQDDGDEEWLTEQQERQRLLAESLKAFKPTFLSMVDRELAGFEARVGEQLRTIESSLDAKRGSPKGSMRGRTAERRRGASRDARGDDGAGKAKARRRGASGTTSAPPPRQRNRTEVAGGGTRGGSRQVNPASP
jgi:hypothetical protein